MFAASIRCLGNELHSRRDELSISASRIGQFRDNKMARSRYRQHIMDHAEEPRLQASCSCISTQSSTPATQTLLMARTPPTVLYASTKPVSATPPAPSRPARKPPATSVGIDPHSSPSRLLSSPIPPRRGTANKPHFSIPPQTRAPAC